MSHQLCLFGRIAVAQVNELADANRILFAQPPDNWRRPPGRPRSTWIQNVCNDLSSFGMELPEAREAAQNQPFWKMLRKYSAMQYTTIVVRGDIGLDVTCLPCLLHG